MLGLLQQVQNATLSVDNKVVSSIGKGVVVYIGVSKDDTQQDADFMAKKIATTRAFLDDNNKVNLTLIDKGYEVLVVSNFTLQADMSRGHRPSFSQAAQRDEAQKLYESVVSKLSDMGVKSVKMGVFGEHMYINSQACGPLNLIIDTKMLLK